MNTTPNNLKLTRPLAALSLVAVISIAHAEGDWVRQSPVPYAFSEMQNFESVAFFTPDHGFISGSRRTTAGRPGAATTFQAALT